MNELEEAMDTVTKRLEEAEQREERMLQSVMPDTAFNKESVPDSGTASDAVSAAEEEREIPGQSEANSFIVKNALEYIRENSQEKLRLVDVAEQVYVSQWHLSKLLNKHAGKTFSDILNSARMEKARELLKDPSLRIYDVAEMVGFQDLAHFSRVFKKMEGMSANEYRNTQT